MKKLRLNAFELEGAEVLTREQLKKVLGGDGSRTGTSDGTSGDTTASDCTAECDESTQHSCTCMDVMCVGNSRQYCEAIGTGCKVTCQ